MNVLSCCLRCGRDTKRDYCFRCIGRNPSRLRGTMPYHEVPLEDDYSEESDADSGAVLGYYERLEKSLHEQK